MGSVNRPGMAIILVFFLIAPAYAAEEDYFDFAENLFAGGDYYRAIGEYKRYIFFSKNGREINTARYKIGLAYLKAGKYDMALDWFGRMEENYTGARKGIIIYGRAVAMHKKGGYFISENMLEKAAGLLDEKTDSGRILYVKALNKIHEGKWEEASGMLEDIKAGYTAGSAERLREYLAENAPKEKAPAPGMIMSAILPGTGYFYSGRFFDGFISMGLNTLCIVNTITSVQSGNTTGQWGWGAAALVAYSANLYGTANAVALFNRAKREKCIEGAREFMADIFIYEF